MIYAAFETVEREGDPLILKNPVCVQDLSSNYSS